MALNSSSVPRVALPKGPFEEYQSDLYKHFHQRPKPPFYTGNKHPLDRMQTPSGKRQKGDTDRKPSSYATIHHPSLEQPPDKIVVIDSSSDSLASPRSPLPSPRVAVPRGVSRSSSSPSPSPSQQSRSLSRYKKRRSPVSGAPYVHPWTLLPRRSSHVPGPFFHLDSDTSAKRLGSPKARIGDEVNMDNGCVTMSEWVRMGVALGMISRSSAPTSHITAEANESVSSGYKHNPLMWRTLHQKLMDVIFKEWTQPAGLDASGDKRVAVATHDSHHAVLARDMNQPPHDSSFHGLPILDLPTPRDADDDRSPRSKRPRHVPRDDAPVCTTSPEGLRRCPIPGNPAPSFRRERRKEAATIVVRTGGDFERLFRLGKESSPALGTVIVLQPCDGARISQQLVTALASFKGLVYLRLEHAGNLTLSLLTMAMQSKGPLASSLRTLILGCRDPEIAPKTLVLFAESLVPLQLHHLQLANPPTSSFQDLLPVLNRLSSLKILSLPRTSTDHPASERDLCARLLAPFLTQRSSSASLSSTPPHVVHLGLRGRKFGDNPFAFNGLCSTIRRAHVLRSLDLSGCALNPRSAVRLADSLSDGGAPSLVSLKLANNSLGDEGFVALFEVLCAMDDFGRFQSHVRDLDVTMNGITVASHGILMPAVLYQRIPFRTLKLTGNPVMDQDLPTFMAALRRCLFSNVGCWHPYDHHLFARAFQSKIRTALLCLCSSHFWDKAAPAFDPISILQFTEITDADWP